MNRRDALSATAALLGGVIIGADFFLSSCTAPQNKSIRFTLDDIGFLDEIGETILPTSKKSPGAKAAKIGEYMKSIVADCYKESEQKVFFNGLVALNDFSKQKEGDEFLSLSDTKKLKVLIAIDKEATEYTKQKKETDPDHYFTMIKQLTIWGYFTSEPGATKALRYVPIPGKYEGCTDYKKGEAAWLY